MQKTQEAIKMNVESTFNKFVTPIERNGTVIGAGAELLSYGVQPLADSISRLLTGNAHLPNLGVMVQDLIYLNPRFKTFATAAVAGWALKGSINNSTIKNLASAAQKIGTGGVIAAALTEVLYYSTHQGEGSNSLGGGRNSNGSPSQIVRY